MKSATLIFAAAIGMAGLAAVPAAAIPCGTITACPTNFASINGLNSTPRMIAAGGLSMWALDNNCAIYRWNTATKVFNQIPDPWCGSSWAAGCGASMTPEMFSHSSRHELGETS
jgi:hypothetical protein